MKTPKQFLPTVDLYLIFEKSSCKNQIEWIWFFVNISYMIFTASVACKNQVPNRQKIKLKNQVCEIKIFKNQVQIDRGYTKFIQLDFLNSIFQKSSADQHGVGSLIWTRIYGHLRWPFFSPFGYGNLLELFRMKNIWNGNNLEGITIFGKNDSNTEGMTIMRKEWHKVFFWKKYFFSSNLSPISFITSVRS